MSSSSNGPPMWAVLGSIEFVILFVFTILLVRFYASKDSPLYANVIVVISWYLGFFGILFLPIDIAEAYYSIYYVTTNTSDTTNSGFPNIDITRNGTTTSPTPRVFPTSSSFSTFSPSFSIKPSSSIQSSTVTVSMSPVSSLSRISTTSSLTVTASISWSPSKSLSSTSTSSIGAVPSASNTRTPTGTRSGTTTPSITPSPTRTSSITPSKKGPSMTRTASQTPFPLCYPNCGGGGGDMGGRRQLDEELNKENRQDGINPPFPSLIHRHKLRSNSNSKHDDDDTQIHHSSTIYSKKEIILTSIYSKRLQIVAPSSSSSSNATNNNSSSSSSSSGSTTDVVIEKALQVRNTQLEGFWVWVYWLTFFNTYILIPMVQEYVAAGEFTKMARIYAAFKINIIFYAVCGVFAFAALAYVVVGLNQGLVDMMPVLISMSNTMGLVIIILLIGYGTAEVPRSFWIESDPELDLRRNYFFAPELDSQLFDARSVLTDLLKKLKNFETKVSAMSSDKSLNEKNPRLASSVPELQRCLAIVNRKANFAQSLPGIKAPKKETPEQTRRRLAIEKKIADETAEDDAENKSNPNGSWFASIGLGSTDKYAGVTLHALAKLHKKLMVEIGNLQKTQFRMNEMVVRCMMLEYVVAHVPPPIPIKKKTVDGKTFYLTPKGSGISGAISQQFINGSSSSSIYYKQY
jgi:hypothetical protein